MVHKIRSIGRAYNWGLRWLVLLLAGCSGLAVLVIIGVTCLDVGMRIFGSALQGSFDIVQIAGALAVAFALPYTTAVKGHVAVEFFFQKLNRMGRIVVDSIVRVLVIALLALLAVQCVFYGISLKEANQVSLTLQAPMFWIPYVISGCLAVTVLVKIHNLIHPGRGMIKP